MDENENNKLKGKLYVQNSDGTWSEICEVKDVNVINTNELTVKDIINTMTQAQKNTLYYYMGIALKEKTRFKYPCTGIESFDENQKKVFYYLVGCALEKQIDLGILEIIKGDN